MHILRAYRWKYFLHVFFSTFRMFLRKPKNENLKFNLPARKYSVCPQNNIFVNVIFWYFFHGLKTKVSPKTCNQINSTKTYFFVLSTLPRENARKKTTSKIMLVNGGKKMLHFFSSKAKSRINDRFLIFRAYVFFASFGFFINLEGWDNFLKTLCTENRRSFIDCNFAIDTFYFQSSFLKGIFELLSERQFHFKTIRNSEKQDACKWVSAKKCDTSR